MKIKTIAIGNDKEAFIEDRLSDKVNIIYSDDNNKGKTIVIQGMMYAIGNEPVFPARFNYKDYYFYVLLDYENTNIEFLRKRDHIVVKLNSEFYELSSLSELKYFINDKIMKLPRIFKDNKEKLVDLNLLYELFFIGQDKRDTSNLTSSYYKKDDFINMLSAMSGYPVLDNDDDLQDKKENIKRLKSEISETKKLLFLRKENIKLSEWINKYEDKESFENTKNIFNKINDDLGYYRRKRKNEINRKIKLEQLLHDLYSLNKEIEKGKVICADCGSDKILYTNKDLQFDVSNSTIRNKVIQSIKYQIEQKTEIVEEYTHNINNLQDKLKQHLSETPEEVRNILLYSDEILSEVNLDNKLKVLTDELEKYENSKANTLLLDESVKEHKKTMITEITNKMNILYNEVDKEGRLVFDNIFAKKTDVYSGSEGQEYYYCRLLSIQKYLKHNFPIIIDSYRDGEVSTYKEELMLKNYKNTDTQVILTATLKKEEYANQKYTSMNDINAIDYSVNSANKILQESSAEKFLEIISSFGINFAQN